MNPDVSVLMPAYNAGKYVAQAVESILAQAYGDFEFIIIDDGSTDNTAQVIERYARRDTRISLRTRTNRGLAATRNELLAAAKGELAAWMDADDVARLDRLERQVCYLRSHPECVAVGTRLLFICEQGVPLYESTQPLGHEEIESELLKGRGQALAQPTAMVRRSAVMAVGGYNERYRVGEDLDLFLRLALRGRLANLSTIGLDYRQHPHSVMHTRSLGEAALLLEMLVRAHRDRSLSPPDAPPAYATALPAPLEDCLRRWGWNALKRSRIDAARRYAIRTLRSNLFSLENWRFVCCALRGH